MNPMKRFSLIISILIAIIFTGCLSMLETDNPFREENLIFSVEIKPSFTRHGQLVLTKQANKIELELSRIWEQSDSLKLNSRNGIILSEADSLLTGKINGASSKTNIFLERLEKVEVPFEQYEQFVRSLGEKVDVANQGHLIKRDILDGITVLFQYQSQYDNNLFGFRCPTPRDSVEFILIRSIFNLMEGGLKSDSALIYTERLKSYFRLGLSVKKVKDEPLEYRIGPYISIKDSLDFNNWIYSLNEYNEPIIIDVSHSYGYWLPKEFDQKMRRLLKEKKWIRFIVNNESIEDLQRIGLDEERMFRNKLEWKLEEDLK